MSKSDIGPVILGVAIGIGISYAVFLAVMFVQLYCG